MLHATRMLHTGGCLTLTGDTSAHVASILLHLLHLHAAAPTPMLSARVSSAYYERVSCRWHTNAHKR